MRVTAPATARDIRIRTRQAETESERTLNHRIPAGTPASHTRRSGRDASRHESLLRTLTAFAGPNAVRKGNVTSAT
jgi:hypothetical protein